MEALKTSIKSWWQRTKIFPWRLSGFLKKRPLNQEEIDKKLVYSLSPRKVPSGNQLRHLKKFLNPREFLIVKICALLILAGAVYLGLIFVRDHLEYLPLRGGTYSEAVVGYPRSINPLYAAGRDVDADLSRLVYSSLYQYDADGQLAPDLALSVEVSADQKEYLVKIKNNVIWHNGEQLTAEDIVFTLELIQNPDFHSSLRSALLIASAEQLDATTIKFKLSEPYSPFLELLTFGILPKTLWADVSPDGALLTDLNLKPVGSGPYRFKSLVKSSAGDLKEYSLEANSNYYGAVPYLTNLNFKFYPNYEEAVKALNAKQVGGLNYLPFGQRQELLSQNSLHFYELAQPRLVSLFFNQAKNKALANKDTRVALAAALDKDKIIRDIFGGVYGRADGPIVPQSWAYNEGQTIYGYAPEDASAHFASSTLSATLTVVDSGQNVAVAEEVKKQWEAAGVKITLRVVTGEQATEIIKNRDFDILLYGQSVGGDPDVYAFWHSSQAGAAGLNLANYSNSEADKLLLEARATADQGQRLEKYRKFQELVTGDLPAIFLYSPTYTYIQSNKLNGFGGRALVQPADRFASVTGWYLKTKKQLSW